MIRKEVLGEGVELYCGDCREILPTLGEFDACVTDPPYGIGVTRSNRLAVSRGMGGGDWDNEPASDEAIALIVKHSRYQIIWGGNYFDLPPTRCVLSWDKNNAGRDFADFELAWTNLDAVARRFLYRPMSMDGGKVHPTQKPLALMKWCLEQLPEGTESVVDPFMGSGSTGCAAVEMGRSFTGIEREPKYFDIACRRIEDALRRPDLFIPTPAPKAKQEAFDL